MASVLLDSAVEFHTSHTDESFMLECGVSVETSQHIGLGDIGTLLPNTPLRVKTLARKSASALPRFTFNAVDTSGLSDMPPLPSPLALEPPLSVPSKGRGHRRGMSEFVGNGKAENLDILPRGNPDGLQGSRALMVQTGPTLDSPTKKRGHAHKRSTAISSQDLPSNLTPALKIVTPSRQQTPQTTEGRPYSSLLDTSSTAAPPAYVIPRLRIGGLNASHFISRPLSTISSEAESSVSSRVPSPTVYREQGRISFISASPRQTSLWNVDNYSINEQDVSPLRPSLDRCVSDPVHTRQDQVYSADQIDVLDVADLKAPLDRRRSAPFLATLNSVKSTSAQAEEPVPITIHPSQDEVDAQDVQRSRIVNKTSAAKFKTWTSAVMQRMDKKKALKPLQVPQNNNQFSVDPIQDVAITPLSEADLDEIFASQDPFVDSFTRTASIKAYPRYDVDNWQNMEITGNDTEQDSTASMIDLDAALGPNKTPSTRRQLHSTRNREMNSPGNIYHRRTESAPVLMPFEQARHGSPMNSPMADVFEEDEEDDLFKMPVNVAHPRRRVSENKLRSEANLGIHTLQVGEDHVPITLIEANQSNPEDLAELETITDDVVETCEEPRASVLTKSSDSSGLVTIVGETLPMVVPSFDQTDENTIPTQYPFLDNYYSDRSFEVNRLGTSASSITDCRTLNSYTSERATDIRTSVDVPSLASYGSTMMSSFPPSRRDFSDRASSIKSQAISLDKSFDVDDLEAPHFERQRKRSSIQSLTKLLPGPFGESRSKLSIMEHANASSPELLSVMEPTRKKKNENRLSRLMFWKSKSSKTLNSPVD